MSVKCINCEKFKKTYCESDMWFEGEDEQLSPEEIKSQVNSDIFCSEYELKIKYCERCKDTGCEHCQPLAYM